MLRKLGRGFSRIRLILYMVVAGFAFVGLASRPELQRAGFDTDHGAATMFVLGGLVTLGWPLILRRFGVLLSQRRMSISKRIGQIFLANAAAAMILAGVAFVIDAPISSLMPVGIGAALFAFHVAIDLPTFFVLRLLRRSGRNYRRILIVGAGPRAHAALREIEDHPEWGYRIIGFVDDGGSNFNPAVPADQVFKFMDAPQILRDQIVDEVLIACPRSMLSEIAPIVAESTMIGVPVTLLTDLFGSKLATPRVGQFGGTATLSFAPANHGEFELLLKRAIDVLGGLVGLAIAAPLIALSAGLIRLTSDGPVFFRQVRTGRNGRSFEMIKLRTMVPDAEARRAELMHLNEMDGPVFKIHDDPRVTPVGGVLRKWSIDELPQFWNVLLGDMSIVGPRPPTPDEVAQYRGSDRRRLSMRPGLTCLWQISGRNQLGFDDWMKLDLQYIDSWSLGEDLRIIAKTIPEVISARGAS
jgi:exopolysaccharide biosynthesis polyprenyl glycosylphosphotransferase